MFFGHKDNDPEFCHWAARIGDKVYEIIRDEPREKYDIGISDREEWIEAHHQMQLFSIGKTVLSDAKLKVIGMPASGKAKMRR